MPHIIDIDTRLAAIDEGRSWLPRKTKLFALPPEPGSDLITTFDNAYITKSIWRYKNNKLIIQLIWFHKMRLFPKARLPIGSTKY